MNVTTGDRITTFLLQLFPKCLQAELRTHRSTSQSHYSSRAIPVRKVIEQVVADPFVPQWTAHQKGMSGSDTLSSRQKSQLTCEWLDARDAAVTRAERLATLGCAKQEANRILEPWMKGACIVTATSEAWESFFRLRTAEGVQPDFRSIAKEIQRLYDLNDPEPLDEGDWHIPWVNLFSHDSLDLQGLLKVSVARSARTSYLNHEGNFVIEKDFALHDRLIKEEHWTPLEHQAKAMGHNYHKWRNLSGWMHYRQHLEEGLMIM